MDALTFEERIARVDRSIDKTMDPGRGLKKLKGQQFKSLPVTPAKDRTRVITGGQSHFEEATPVLKRTRPRSGTQSQRGTPTTESFPRTMTPLGAKIRRIKGDIWAQRLSKQEIDAADRRTLTEYISNNADSLPGEELRYARNRRDSLPEEPKKPRHSQMLQEQMARALGRPPKAPWTKKRIDQLSPEQLHQTMMNNFGKWPEKLANHAQRRMEEFHQADRRDVDPDVRRREKQKIDDLSTEELREILAEPDDLPEWVRNYMEHRLDQAQPPDVESMDEEQLRAVLRAGPERWGEGHYNFAQDRLREVTGAVAAPASEPELAPQRKATAPPRAPAKPWTAYYAKAKERDALAAWRQRWRSSLGWGRWDARYVQPLLRTII